MSSVLLGKPGSPSLLTPHSCLSWGGSEENLNRNRKPGNPRPLFFSPSSSCPYGAQNLFFLPGNPASHCFTHSENNSSSWFPVLTGGA